MDQIAVGRFIAQKRKEQNLTQEQFAEKIGVSNKTVSKWETGKCMPDYSVIEAVCKELHIGLAELLRGGDTENDVYANQAIWEALREQKKRKNKKILWIGCLCIVLGITQLILSQCMGETDFQLGLSGLLLGASFPEMALGVFLVCFSLKKKGKSL